MATLVCKTLEYGDYAFSIQPALPVFGMADPHRYTTELSHAGRMLYQGEPSVGNAEQGHFYVYILANAFRRSDLLIRRDLGYKLWTPDYVDPGYGQRETAHLVVEALDFEITLSGIPSHRTKQPRVHGSLTFVIRTSSETGLADCLRLSFFTPVAAAKAFGESLFSECRDVAVRRKSVFPDDLVHDPFRPMESPHHGSEAA